MGRMRKGVELNPLDYNFGCNRLYVDEKWDKKSWNGFDPTVCGVKKMVKELCSFMQTAITYIFYLQSSLIFLAVILLYATYVKSNS